MVPHPYRATGLRILVLGYMVRGPLGGMAWHHLQYVMGLSNLGHEVYFIEDSDDYPSCYDPEKYVTDVDPSYGLRFAADCFARVGLADSWVYYDAHTSRWLGPCAASIHKLCQSADMVLNLSGGNPLRAWLQDIPCRVFVDTDPVFTQIQHLTEPSVRELALRHNAFFSFGEKINDADCGIPNDGLPWQTTRQPIVLDTWSPMPGRPSGAYTTVMQWNSYKTPVYQDRCYGMKSLSFQPYLDLPAKTRSRLELALGGAEAPRDVLRDKGWRIRDPLEVARTPWSYQDYISQSKGEFTVAKHGYVVSRSGWFSERSACYLASGRPVITEETGFSDWMVTGRGILSFSSPEEAIAAIETINDDYEMHCQAAREITERYFDARKVLTTLIERALNETE